MKSNLLNGILAAAVACTLATAVHAQRGGRGGVAGPALTPAQQAALGGMNISTELTNAATQAESALVAASLATPSDPGTIQTRAQAVADAELALALARADAFATAQRSLMPVTTDQAVAFAGRGGRGGANPAPYEDYTGFVSLWDGRTFTNWDGETNVWSIDNGAIHADTTITPGQHHLHYVGPGYLMRDFDLKVEVKMSGNANGGIQYRSRLLNPAHRQDWEPEAVGGRRDHAAAIADPLGKDLPAGITTVDAAVEAGVVAGGGGGSGGNPWQISGYQFDMNTGNNYTGQLYEGQGRGIVNPPGGFVELLRGGGRVTLARVAENPAQYVHEHLGLDGEWNQFEIIARGNTLVHLINGHVITVTIDDDPEQRSLQGILSLQLEGGGQIWYRNVYYKDLTPTTVAAR